ncbi:MAG: MarR family transcriptional regulator [Betaproteobacteria bacterium]|nr:MarR family transcriptional regulator [Betaproteobacteria bacterium]
MSREPRPDFDLEHHPFFWMTQAIAARDAALAGELKAHGLRVPEWRVLAALYARKRLSMRELADLSSIDRTTLSRTVDRMQESDWVTRLADSRDLRVTRLSLTALGERLFARIWPTMERLNRAAMEGLPPGSVPMLAWTLGRMKENLDREVPERQDAA